MFGKSEFNPFFILAVVCTALAEASKVKQNPEKVEMLVGHDASFYCSFPLFRDRSKIKIFWWKDGEREFYKPRQDPRKSFEVQSKANGVFKIQDVRFRDAGVYYCRVEGETTGNGTGTTLTVKSSPEPLTISQRQSADDSLWCNTSGFYPTDYTLSWYKNGQEVTIGVNNIEGRNNEGLTVVSSNLKEMQPAQHGTVYLCKVSHSTLRVPASANYTVNTADTSITARLSWWIYLCGGIFVLLLISLIIVCCKFCKHKAHKDKVQTKTCVRCTQPITAKPNKRKKQEPVKDSTQMTTRNPSRTADTNDPPKVKKHRKKRSEPMGV